ncbi:MAG TPA: hypothetical protein VGR11_02505 [Solirubrobacteraceae bacterium]|nr:hypothetical protein [Solirubrobacteraceae bacterium]
MGILRALHESELESAGAARAEALRRADQELDRIARLIPDALGAGLSMTEIGRFTGVSRPTLYELRARYSDAPRDLRIAVMQALMTQDTSHPDAIAEHLGRSAAEVRPIIDDFLARQWIAYDFDGPRSRLESDQKGGVAVVDDAGAETLLSVTLAGYEALERWRFDADEGKGDE